MAVEFRNAVARPGGAIDAEINHPVFGWIEYTAQDASGEAYQQEVWDALNAPGAVVAASTPRPGAVVTATRVQVALWLHDNGFPNGFENASVQAVIAAGSEEAQIRFRSARKFSSDDPILQSMATALGVSDLAAALTAAKGL